MAKIALIGASGNIGDRVLAEALSRGHSVTGIVRLIAVVGAGSLQASPGVRVLDTGSPSWNIVPGQRTAKFRVGGDELLRDAAGESRISREDFAVAIVDEIERPKHHRQRITVGY